MSRHGINWKPGGVLPKDIGITIKMQKLPEPAAPAQKKVIACESPPLMAVWVDQYDNFATDIIVPDTTQIYEAIRPAIATLVNADWETNGLASPLCIDGSAVEWASEFVPECHIDNYDNECCGTEIHASFGLAFAATMRVAPQYSGLNDTFGVLYATPSYKGVTLNTITATLKVIGW